MLGIQSFIHHAPSRRDLMRVSDCFGPSADTPVRLTFLGRGFRDLTTGDARGRSQNERRFSRSFVNSLLTFLRFIRHMLSDRAAPFSPFPRIVEAGAANQIVLYVVRTDHNLARILTKHSGGFVRLLGIASLTEGFELALTRRHAVLEAIQAALSESGYPLSAVRLDLRHGQFDLVVNTKRKG
jgi:hypothetical protein